MPLVLCGTPIGNVADAGPRLAETLLAADVIAAEDTRRLRRLAGQLGLSLTAKVVSYYDAVEKTRTETLLAELRAGRTVALVTDAGMPAVSDPGYRLVAAAVAEGLVVSVVPGPSALTAALAVSGLPSDRVAFEGFLPRKGADRRRRLAALRAEPRTLVLLESPHRISPTLRDLAEAFGPARRAVLCRELTKTFEEVLRGPLGELAEVAAARQLRGEITLVVAGVPEPTEAEQETAQREAAARGAENWPAEVARLQGRGLDRAAATSAVAKAAGVSRRAVFDALVAAKAAPPLAEAAPPPDKAAPSPDKAAPPPDGRD